MKIFIYEFASGGGGLARDMPLPGGILSEGRAMLTSLIADFYALDGVKITTLRDARHRAFQPPDPWTQPCDRCCVVDVSTPAEERAAFHHGAAEADWTVVIAPEFDGLLWERACWVEAAGGRLLGPSPDFIALAGDKQRTAERLDAAGVPVPYGRVLSPCAPLPRDFPYPAVVKPIDGAGSVGVELVPDADHGAAKCVKPRRLERFCPGSPASVSLLCGPNLAVALPPCRQHLSQDGRFQYQGGSYPLGESHTRRARKLALQTCRALQGARGYVGVDLVLGEASDAAADVVIEVNPRLTTSYLGLRAATTDNLARAMMAAATGQEVTVAFHATPIRFAPHRKPRRK